MSPTAQATVPGGTAGALGLRILVRVRKNLEIMALYTQRMATRSPFQRPGRPLYQWSRVFRRAAMRRNPSLYLPPLGPNPPDIHHHRPRLVRSEASRLGLPVASGLPECKECRAQTRRADDGHIDTAFNPRRQLARRRCEACGSLWRASAPPCAITRANRTHAPASSQAGCGRLTAEQGSGHAESSSQLVKAEGA